MRDVDSPSRQRPFLRSRRAAAVFVAAVFLATVVQVLAEPIAALTTAGAEWPLPLSPAVAVVLLVIGCGVQSAALLLSDRQPGLAVVVAMAVYLALAVGLSIPNWVAGMRLVIALALFLCATRVRVGVAGAWLVAVIVVSFATLFIWAVAIGTPMSMAAGFVVVEVVELAALALGATALGVWWGVQSRRAAEAQERAEEAERQLDARVREAGEQERTRIAQELHDVAGQHLAGLITLADAALALTERQPGRALALIEDVRNEGRFAAASLAGALADLKTMGTVPGEAVSDLQRAEELVAYWRRRGMSVRFAAVGDLGDVPAVVSTMGYRSIQEALTNAAKHAPGSSVDVAIERDAHALEITVSNEGAPDAAEPLPGLGLGWGLSGIRERVELLQGSLTAGAENERAWMMRISIPLETAEQVSA